MIFDLRSNGELCVFCEIPIDPFISLWNNFSVSLTLRLAIGMVYMDVHGSVQGADQGGLVGTQSLVGSVNGFCLPVRPIDVLLKQSHGKDVGDVMAENCQATRKQ